MNYSPILCENVKNEKMYSLEVLILNNVSVQELWDVCTLWRQSVTSKLCTLLSSNLLLLQILQVDCHPFAEFFCAMSKSLQTIYLKSASGGSVMCFHGNVKCIRNELHDAYLSNYRKDNDNHMCKCELYIKISQMNP